MIVFFFQAEDGIRDRNVTGVQTCALPICNLRLEDLKAMIDPEVRKILQEEGIIQTTWRELKERREKVGNSGAPAKRSEERRVGKKCRSRLTTENTRKKRNNHDVKEVRSIE